VFLFKELRQTEGTRLIEKMADELKEVSFGQDEAISKLLSRYSETELVLKILINPLGTFIFLGPTGVEKHNWQKFLQDFFSIH